MFHNCPDITEIDLFNFDTSKVTNMNCMFCDCPKLSSLNISNFNTSKVTDMWGMFDDCPLLSSLNLSHFDTSKVTDMGIMFQGCLGLEYINLKYFIENFSLSVDSIFSKVPNNVIVCLNENSTKILAKIKEKNKYSIDCSECWRIKEKKTVNKTVVCSDYHNNDILYRYKYEGKYYENCLNGNLINFTSSKNCKCDEDECFLVLI